MKVLLSCRHTSLLLSQREERPLSRRERLALRLHLLICVYCRRYARQLRRLRRMLRHLGRQTRLDPGARERIRSAIRRDRSAN